LELSDPEENLTQIRYLHGLACVQTGDMQEAEESFLMALEKDATLDGIHYYIGVCQMSREAYTDAVANLTVAVDSGSLIQLSRYSRGVCGLMIEGYDLELAVEDIVFAAEYDQPDADPAVTQQAADLLAYLISLAEQEDTDPDAVTDNGAGG
jgi:tetratricopeptide (TPR) repeat protein